MWGDAAVTRFIGGRASTPQQCWSRMLTYRGMWPLLGYGYWAVEEKNSGLYIGEAGFADFKRDIIPAMQNVPELGFALVPPMHGKGYATEAARAVLVWGDAHLPSARTVAMVHQDNAVSQRVLDKVGYCVFERTVFADQPALFLERIAR